MPQGAHQEPDVNPPGLWCQHRRRYVLLATLLTVAAVPYLLPADWLPTLRPLPQPYLKQPNSGVSGHPALKGTSGSSRQSRPPENSAASGPSNQTAGGPDPRHHDSSVQLTTPYITSRRCKGPGLPQASPSKEFDLTRLGPFKFLPEYRNPCWMAPKIKTLKCLPYFYLAGFPKCGTTDLYRRISLHPAVSATKWKEPHWITRIRFNATHRFHSLNFYLSFFAHAITAEYPAKKRPMRRIVGDGSASTAWDNRRWIYLPGNQHCSSPRVLIADYIHHLLPDAKIIMILRNPTDRMYSDYLYPNQTGKSKEHFHTMAEQQVNEFNACLKTWPLRHCAYNGTVSGGRFQIGLYTVFIEDWLLRFPRHQILILRSEDFARDVVASMAKVFSFLGLDKPDVSLRQRTTKLEKQNVRNKTVGVMLEKTRRLLDQFFLPFNQRLATVLGNSKYLWRDTKVSRP